MSQAKQSDILSRWQEFLPTFKLLSEDELFSLSRRECSLLRRFVALSPRIRGISTAQMRHAYVRSIEWPFHRPVKVTPVNVRDVAVAKAASEAPDRFPY